MVAPPLVNERARFEIAAGIIVVSELNAAARAQLVRGRTAPPGSEVEAHTARRADLLFGRSTHLSRSRLTDRRSAAGRP